MYTFSFLPKKILSIFSVESCILCKKESEPLCEPCISLLTECKDCVDPCSSLFLSYRDAKVKKLLRLAKYEHKTSLYEPLILAWLKKEDMLSLFLKEKSDTLLTGIPMHRRRLLFRGYSHTHKIVSLLAKETSVESYPSLLTKKRFTGRQALLSRKERLVAQKDSFEISESAKRKLQGKRIILVDDVMTTGSTFREARKVLLSSGAKEVVCIALAH